MIRLLPLFALIAATNALAQTPARVIAQIEEKLKSVKSYTTSLNLKVDVPFIEAPPSKATLYYKAPDKSHLEAEGFAMLPKQGADLNVTRLLAQPHVAVDAGREEFQGVTMRKIKVLPADDQSPVAVATFLIDTTMMLPRKVITTTRSGGTLVAELVYDNAAASAYALPSYTKLVLEIPMMDLPRTMTGDFDKKKRDQPNKPVKAIVEIWYTNYRFNIPIPDSVFSN